MSGTALQSVFPASWTVLTATDANEHAALAAEVFAREVVASVVGRGVCRVALSGGSTPLAMFRRLASMALPWDHVELYWVDERAVPPTSSRSNFGEADKALGFSSLGFSGVFRMEADAPDLDASRLRYERLLRERFGVASAIRFDILLLGIGDDGHTASLFPRTGAALVEDRLVVAVDADATSGREARLSLSAPVLREAGLLLVLAAGAQKNAALSSAFCEGSWDDVPARLIRASRGRVVWVLDRAAYPAV